MTTHSPPPLPLTRILCWTITPAVLDAGGVSSTPDMIKELSVSLPAVRTILPGPLAPGPELAAVDHRDSPQQRASARESGLAVVTLATRECDPDRSKKLAGCSRVTAARRRRPRARCTVHGARCRVAVASRARKKLVATGGFEPVSSKTSRRRYQLDYEAQIRYMLVISSPPLSIPNPADTDSYSAVPWPPYDVYRRWAADRWLLTAGG